MTFKRFSPHKYLFIMTLTVSIKQCEKVNIYKPNTPFCVPLPVLSRYQAERAQGLYPDTTVQENEVEITGDGAYETLESLTGIP